VPVASWPRLRYSPAARRTLKVGLCRCCNLSVQTPPARCASSQQSLPGPAGCDPACTGDDTCQTQCIAASCDAGQYILGDIGACADCPAGFLCVATGNEHPVPFSRGPATTETSACATAAPAEPNRQRGAQQAHLRTARVPRAARTAAAVLLDTLQLLQGSRAALLAPRVNPARQPLMSRWSVRLVPTPGRLPLSARSVQPASTAPCPRRCLSRVQTAHTQRVVPRRARTARLVRSARQPTRPRQPVRQMKCQPQTQ
jgi:hypothetical protein